MTKSNIDNGKAADYKVFLSEPSRTSGRGGNANALHSHVLTVGGVDYTFVAPGAQKWAFKGDTVSFAYETTDVGGKTVNKLDRDTLTTTATTGKPIVRGNRTFKG